jgi:tetratricopeptide (TPR) repeat protein
VGLLRIGSRNPEQTRRVQSWLTEPLKKRPTVSLLLAQAELLDFQTRYKEAIDLYQRILQRDERNALALNNLAWLLALHAKQPDQALATINRAVATAGPNPTLLDTRAVIQVQLGQASLALKDLDRVLAQEPSGSVHFHRAWAFLEAKDRVSAREALRRAKAAGLQPADLHSLEQDDYQEVLANLDLK